MKSILMSLKPYYYYLIGEEIKQIELRKKQPKAKDWNKEVLLYMSKDEKSFAKIPKEFQEKYRKHFGKVGLKFVCNKIEAFAEYDLFDGMSETTKSRIEEYSCVDIDDLLKYLGGANCIYGWHVSNLTFDENPKRTGEFFVKGACKANYCSWCKHLISISYFEPPDCLDYSQHPLTRPPQSYCYVEVEE